MKIKIKGFDDDSYRDIYGVLEGEERQGKFCIGENGKFKMVLVYLYLIILNWLK